jgi:hypothetical protein
MTHEQDEAPKAAEERGDRRFAAFGDDEIRALLRALEEVNTSDMGPAMNDVTEKLWRGVLDEYEHRGLVK